MIPPLTFLSIWFLYNDPIKKKCEQFSYFIYLSFLDTGRKELNREQCRVTMLAKCEAAEEMKEQPGDQAFFLVDIFSSNSLLLMLNNYALW